MPRSLTFQKKVRVSTRPLVCLTSPANISSSTCVRGQQAAQVPALHASAPEVRRRGAAVPRPGAPLHDHRGDAQRMRRRWTSHLVGIDAAAVALVAHAHARAAARGAQRPLRSTRARECEGAATSTCQGCDQRAARPSSRHMPAGQGGAQVRAGTPHPARACGSSRGMMPARCAPAQAKMLRGADLRHDAPPLAVQERKLISRQPAGGLLGSEERNCCLLIVCVPGRRRSQRLHSMTHTD